ncbi:unnamed protein product [Caenorhabditis brenneri]
MQLQLVFVIVTIGFGGAQPLAGIIENALLTDPLTESPFVPFLNITKQFDNTLDDFNITDNFGDYVPPSEVDGFEPPQLDASGEFSISAATDLDHIPISVIDGFEPLKLDAAVHGGLQVG